MSALGAVYRRELASYFATPIAYVFVVVFLLLAGAFTFYLGSFYERGQADLAPFFNFHPWLYLFLVPAVAMRSWAEERRSGSIELLLTLPVRPGEAVVAKFLAAWTFVAIALALTFPIWITVAWLGDPDHGAIFAGYLGSLLMAGAFLAIGNCLSAATRSQVVAFILTVVVCFLLLLAGFPLVLDPVRAWAPEALVDTVAGLSFLTHFASISKGVVDARDLLYFGTTIAVWLYATTLVLAATRAPRTRGLGAATLVALALLFVGLTMLFDHAFRGARLDLTANRLYTLASGTERLVETLPEPVNLYFYFSREAAEPVPQLRTYATRVRELLEEIATRSGGKVRLHVVDPAPYSDDEDRASEFGLRSVPVGASGDPVYFGLAGTNSTDGRAIIEFFNPQQEELLEYDVARLLHELAAPKRKVVGLLSTLPVAGGFDAAGGGMQPGWAIADGMRELFDVRSIAPDANELPQDLDVLMVVQPKGLSAALKYSIDQYVLRGGRLLLFVDPDSQQDPSAAQRAALYAGGDRASTFEPMLSAWGVKYDAGRAFGDLRHALLVGDPAEGSPQRHLAFLGLGSDAFAKGDPITSALDTVNLATPGFLVWRGAAGATFEPLLTSSADSAPLPVEKLAMAVTPDSLRSGFEPTGERYVAAARISGSLASAYPDGPPAGVAAAAPHLKVASRPANIVVVADTDLLSDMLWVRTQTVFGQRYTEAWANNGDFVLNALDNLTGSADLISIRGRATFSRPFTRVDELRARADDRLRTKAADLERALSATEQELANLQRRREDQASLALSPEQQRELERFQREKIRIRKELRETRRGLDEEIEALGTRLRLLNIAAVPALLSVVALVAVALRRRRRRPAPEARA